MRERSSEDILTVTGTLTDSHAAGREYLLRFIGGNQQPDEHPVALLGVARTEKK
jgi:hypothetical protein